MSKGWGNHGAPPLKPLIHPLPQFTSVHAHLSVNCMAHISGEHQFCSKLLECSLPTGVSILLTPIAPQTAAAEGVRIAGARVASSHISAATRGAKPFPALI